MYRFFGLCFLALTTASVLQRETEIITSPSLSLANSEFSLKIYRELAKKTSNNAVFSPLSLSTALSITLEGASGRTALEIGTSMGYSNLPRQLRHDEQKKLVNSLKSKTDYVLEMANSVWIEEHFSVLPAFKKTAIEVFNAEESRFNTETGHININRWVERKTNGKITDLVEQLSSDTVMLLLNAIYFKGTWEIAFNESDNFQDVFQSSEQKYLRPNLSTFMKLNTKFPYAESDLLRSQILEIPYKGGDMKMIVILPWKGVSLSEVEENLSAQTLIREIKATRPRLVSLILPKFKIENFFDLNGPLNNVGIREAFQDTADFTLINPYQHMKVSKVIQKARIEINEVGSEAAAATAIIFETRSSHSLNSIVRFNANHPFLFMVYHEPTSTIIFIGRVMKP